MPLHHLPYQVEADPGAGDILEFRVVNPVELLEQVPPCSLRDANPMVPDHQVDSAVLAVADDLDTGRAGTELDGVLEQVVQRCAQPLGITEHGKGSLGQIEAEPTLFELDLRLDAIDRFADHRA